MQTELEHIIMTSYKEQMISFMEANPEVFEEAVELALGDRQPYCWRAAWLLWSCIKENDTRLQKHIKKILSVIPAKKDGHQRELIKILYIMELDDEQEGYLFDICMTLWEQINKSPSVRYNAFRFIVKMAKKHPELSNEVQFLTQDHFLDTLSPGVKHSMTKMLKKSNLILPVN